MIALALALSLQPPMLLRIEQPSVVYAPDGQRISLPAGTELDEGSGYPAAHAVGLVFADRVDLTPRLVDLVPAHASNDSPETRTAA